MVDARIADAVSPVMFRLITGKTCRGSGFVIVGILPAPVACDDRAVPGDRSP